MVTKSLHFITLINNEVSQDENILYFFILLYLESPFNQYPISMYSGWRSPPCVEFFEFSRMHYWSLYEASGASPACTNHSSVSSFVVSPFIWSQVT